ncbi:MULTISPECIES: hypothetical protein [unclassified Leptolyngbya]|uniref:hypothetical protein n=1 Tax=unclassified Leptolyngbya TaxID=2650499 RepID=UPI00168734C4|nr:MULTISPECIES: hypothetical protein [unclassified Leptolyngbya]MBD1910340.1 hypothetical protein [Leptolyngbya sp. FACHB-8]MBD2154857.1 hypothetical protein [Leptolyngbya sp. FACHB-16]
MTIGTRLQQDFRYLFQGFINSLVMVILAGLAIAALTLLLLAIAPGSIGETLRTLIPPSQLMAWMLFGAIVEIASLWLLPRYGLFPQRLSKRLCWFTGIITVVSMVLSVLLSAIT